MSKWSTSSPNFLLPRMSKLRSGQTKGSSGGNGSGSPPARGSDSTGAMMDSLVKPGGEREQGPAERPARKCRSAGRRSGHGQFAGRQRCGQGVVMLAAPMRFKPEAGTRRGLPMKQDLIDRFADSVELRDLEAPAEVRGDRLDEVHPGFLAHGDAQDSVGAFRRNGLGDPVIGPWGLGAWLRRGALAPLGGAHGCSSGWWKEKGRGSCPGPVEEGNGLLVGPGCDLLLARRALQGSQHSPGGVAQFLRLLAQFRGH